MTETAEASAGTAAPSTGSQSKLAARGEVGIGGIGSAVDAERNRKARRGGMGRLRRLLMVCAGSVETKSPPGVAASAQGLSSDGRRRVEAMTHYWEWAEAVIASSDRASRESAEIVSGGGPVTLAADLRPFEAAGSTNRGVGRFVARILRGPQSSVLVVTRQTVIHEIASELGVPLPADRPLPAEMVLLTRRDDGRWHLGRRSSDPPPLENPLERQGLSGDPDERAPDRHAGRLEIAVESER